ASKVGNSDDGLSDTLNGGLGNDTLTVGGGVDNVDGGDGDDLLIVDYSTETNNLNMAGANNVISDFTNTSVSFAGIERFNVTLGSGNDTVTSGAGSDTLNGGAGNDTLNSGQGNAVIDGGADGDLWVADFGNNATAAVINLNLAGINATGNGSTYANLERLNVLGGAGNDVFTSCTGTPNDGFSDTLNGGLGNDTLTVGGGSDVVEGGVGGDDVLIIDYATDTGNLSMANANTTISDFSNTSVTFSGFERMDIRTGTGNDNIIAGSGNDTLRGGGGFDTLDGGAGIDVVDLQDMTGAVRVTYTNATTALATGPGGQTVTLRNIEGVAGGSVGDTLGGSAQANALIGNGGNDVINAGGGSDTLVGGAGRDTLTGGAGVDQFVYLSLGESTVATNLRDTITDFDATLDKINLVAISQLPGGPALSFVGSAAFSAIGQVRAFDDGTDTIVEVNALGNLNADMAIRLTGIVALDALDFLFV
ncbi:MAG: calcium-binding protein, partial [Paracoccaceae bacterium]